jgi:hypothetical protein
MDFPHAYLAGEGSLRSGLPQLEPAGPRTASDVLWKGTSRRDIDQVLRGYA